MPEPPDETTSVVARRTLLAATAMAVPAVTILAASPALAASETATATLSPSNAQIADGDSQLFTLTVLSGNGKALANESVNLFVSTSAKLPGLAVSIDGGGSVGGGGFLPATTNAAGQVLLRAKCGRLTAEQGGKVTLNAGVTGIGAIDATAEFDHGSLTLATAAENPTVGSTVQVSGALMRPFGLGPYPTVTSVKLSLPADSGLDVPSPVPVRNGAFSADFVGPLEPKVLSVTATDDYLVATLDISFIAAVTGPDTTWGRGKLSTYLSFLTDSAVPGNAYAYNGVDVNVDLQVPDYTTPAGVYYTARTWKRGVRGWRSNTNRGPTVAEAPGTWINGGEGMHFGLRLNEGAMPYPSRSPVLPDDFPATINVRLRPGTGKWASNYLFILNSYHVGIVTSVGGQNVTTAQEWDANRVQPAVGRTAIDISSLIS